MSHFLSAFVPLFVSVVIAGFVFRFSALVIRALGPAGTRALSKIAALFLAAIAVMMVRKGVVAIAGGYAH